MRPILPAVLALALAGAASAAEAPLPSPDAIRAAAAEARKRMWHAPTGTQYRSMHAVMLPGPYNRDKPGVPYVGFCGEINIPDARAERWGRPGWKPLHVAGAQSVVGGQTPYMNMADTVQPVKCAGKKSAEDYSAVFNNPEPSVIAEP